MTVEEDIENAFPPLGRHAYMPFAAVRELVHKIKPGRLCQGNLEKAHGQWRLRVSYKSSTGKRCRRGITLPDDETVNWVREYLRGTKCKEEKI